MTKAPKSAGAIGGPQIGRREALLAGLGTGVVGAGLGVAVPQAALAFDGADGRGIVPADGAVSQTATLQQALNEAAASSTPLSLPAGTYKTGTLTLQAGTHVLGVPGRTILKSDGPPILAIEDADNVRLSGLVLDGGGVALGDGGALMTVSGATAIDVSACRFLNSGGGGMN